MSTRSNILYFFAVLLIVFPLGVCIFAYIQVPTPDMALNSLAAFYTALIGVAAVAASEVYRNQDKRDKQRDEERELREKERMELQNQIRAMHELARGVFSTIFRGKLEIRFVCSREFSWAKVVLQNAQQAKRLLEVLHCLTSSEFHLFFTLYDALPEKEQCNFDVAYTELMEARLEKSLAERSDQQWSMLASMVIDDAAVNEGHDKWTALFANSDWPQILMTIAKEPGAYLGYSDDVIHKCSAEDIKYQFQSRYYGNARSLFKYLRQRFSSAVILDRNGRSNKSSKQPSTDVWLDHFKKWLGDPSILDVKPSGKGVAADTRKAFQSPRYPDSSRSRKAPESQTKLEEDEVTETRLKGSGSDEVEKERREQKRSMWQTKLHDKFERNNRFIPSSVSRDDIYWKEISVNEAMSTNELLQNDRLISYPPTPYLLQRHQPMPLPESFGMSFGASPVPNLRGTRKTTKQDPSDGSSTEEFAEETAAEQRAKA